MTDLFRPADRVFVDESKSHGYWVVATASSVASTSDSEKALRSLLKPGQRRLHFKSERDSRRRKILSRMTELDVRVGVWATRRLPDKEARIRCLTSLTREAGRARVSDLIIERDESVTQADRRIIAAALRAESATGVHYEHVQPHEQPLLWVSDAVAWCCSNGGDWMRRVRPLVEDHIVRW